MTDVFERVSVHEHPLMDEASRDCLDQVCKTNRALAEVYKELPFFCHAFYYHHVAEDFKKAKKLYKEALRRAEFTRGSFNMLLSIFLCECTAHSQPHQPVVPDYGKLSEKLARL